MTWHAGSHTGWDTTLDKSIVQSPGSRGGHGYYNSEGHWEYGDPPEDDEFDPFGGFDPSQEFAEYHDTETPEGYEDESDQETERHKTALLKEVRDFIRGEGGIRRYHSEGRHGREYMAEEYDRLPHWAKNRRGHPLDRMAQLVAAQYPSLGIEDASTLHDYLLDHERERVGGYSKSLSDEDDDLLKSGEVHHPGAHGSTQWYIDHEGHVQYGTPPQEHKRASFRHFLLSLRPQIADAANKILDGWQQDEDGYDEEYGGGGVCDAIAQEVMGIIAHHAPEHIEVVDGGQDGDDHAWVIAHDGHDAFGIDIDPHVYEEGGGYSWRKIEGAHVSPEDVEVFPVDLPEEDFEYSRRNKDRVPLSKSEEVQHPGSRGGHGYYNDEGHWVYGVRPYDKEPPFRRTDFEKLGVTLFHELGGKIPNNYEIRQALEREYGPNVTFYTEDGETAREAARRAHAIAGLRERSERHRETEHDERGFMTSPRLREHQDAIRERGYLLDDQTTYEPLEDRLATWEAVNDVTADLHRVLPGLSALLQKQPLELMVSSADPTQTGVRGEHMRPQGPGLPNRMLVNSHFPRTFMHEMGHYIDNAIATTSPFPSWDYRHMASMDMPHTPLAQLANRIKSNPAYQNWVEQRQANKSYWSRPSEVVARFFDTWVNHQLGKKPSDDYEPYSDEDLDKLGDLLRASLREQRLIKAFLAHWERWRHDLFKGTVVQHPGSRGGHPWWDGHEWRYDKHPQNNLPPAAPKENDYKFWKVFDDAPDTDNTNVLLDHTIGTYYTYNVEDSANDDLRKWVAHLSNKEIEMAARGALSEGEHLGYKDLDVGDLARRLTALRAAARSDMWPHEIRLPKPTAKNAHQRKLQEASVEIAKNYAQYHSYWEKDLKKVKTPSDLVLTALRLKAWDTLTEGSRNPEEPEFWREARNEMEESFDDVKATRGVHLWEYTQRISLAEEFYKAEHHLPTQTQLDALMANNGLLERLRQLREQRTTQRNIALDRLRSTINEPTRDSVEVPYDSEDVPEAREVSRRAKLRYSFRRILHAFGVETYLTSKSIIEQNPNLKGKISPSGIDYADAVGLCKDGQYAWVFDATRRLPHNLASTAVHERGHALDRALGYLYGKVNYDKDTLAITDGISTHHPDRSQMADFQKVYSANKNNELLWWYMRTNPQEMFAEGFNMWNGTSDSLAKAAFDEAAPDLYNFFDSICQEADDHIDEVESGNDN